MQKDEYEDKPKKGVLKCVSLKKVKHVITSKTLKQITRSKTEVCGTETYTKGPDGKPECACCYLDRRARLLGKVKKVVKQGNNKPSVDDSYGIEAMTKILEPKRVKRKTKEEKIAAVKEWDRNRRKNEFDDSGIYYKVRMLAWAKENGIKLKPFTPNFKKLRRKANEDI